jgi:hypothetical protein
MHYSYTGGRHKKHVFHLDPPKNVLLLHWKKTLKIFLIDFPPNKCSKFLLLSLKSLLQKRGMGYAKIIHKKRRRDKKRIKNG